MDWLEKDYQTTSGITLHYGEIPGPGDTLVLIHGEGMAFRDYDTALPHLAGHFHLYAVDCPGHGKSSKNPAEYSCRRIGGTVAEFLRNMAGPCLLAGHSSGAILAAYVAGAEPELVRGVLLEDPPFFKILPEEMENTFLWKNRFLLTHRFLSQPWERDYFLFYYRYNYILHALSPSIAEKIYDDAWAYRQQHPTGPIKLQRLPTAAMQSYRFWDDYDLQFSECFYTGSWFDGVTQEALLQEIPCPTVYLKAKTRYGDDGVLWSANDGEDARRVEELIPRCRRVNVRSGHSVHFERPRAFCRAVRILAQDVRKARR